MAESINIFPVYRKYKGKPVYFKIISFKEFYEKSLIGKEVRTHHIVATQFPERILISDMVAKDQDRWEDSFEQEFENVS